jgi:hypothetical protein
MFILVKRVSLEMKIEIKTATTMVMDIESVS